MKFHTWNLLIVIRAILQKRQQLYLKFCVFLDLNVIKVYCLMREIVGGHSNWLISEKIDYFTDIFKDLTHDWSPSINVSQSIIQAYFFSRNAFSEAVLEPVLLRKAWMNIVAIYLFIIAIYLFMSVFFVFTARLKANLC